jgi:hypothetical protein
MAAFAIELGSFHEWTYESENHWKRVEVSKKVAELAQLFRPLCPAKLARVRPINQAKSTCVRNKRSKK